MTSKFLQWPIRVSWYLNSIEEGYENWIENFESANEGLKEELL